MNIKMGAAETHRTGTTAIPKILGMLAALRQSPAGSVIYSQVEIMLQGLLDEHRDVEDAYFVLIGQLLDAYASHLRQGSALQVQVSLLRSRIQPPLSTA